MSDSVRTHRRQPTRLHHPWDSPGKNTGVSCHFLLQCMKVNSESEVAQLCLTLSDPMDCSLPGSSIQGIFQAKVLEWGAIAFSMELEIQANVAFHGISSCSSFSSMQNPDLLYTQVQMLHTGHKHQSDSGYLVRVAKVCSFLPSLSLPFSAYHAAPSNIWLSTISICIHLKLGKE